MIEGEDHLRVIKLTWLSSHSLKIRELRKPGVHRPAYSTQHDGSSVSRELPLRLTKGC